MVAFGSLVAAVLGDVAVEASIAVRAFGGYLDRSYRTIVPVAMLAAGLLLLVRLGSDGRSRRRASRFLAEFRGHDSLRPRRALVWLR